MSKLFPFVQFEFGFMLGPADGRYLARSSADAEPESVVVLRTLGAPQRRMMGGRRARRVDSAEDAEPVPTSRVTLVRASPFESEDDASAWLGSLRADPAGLTSEVDRAAAELNALLRLHRAAAADPYARDVSERQALAVRVGYGSGDEVAEGRFSDALALPRTPPKRPRGDTLAPQERLASLLNAREHPLACEELALRARADLDAGRYREAALQARVALEAALAELPEKAASDLASYRQAVGQAANAALQGELDDPLREAVAECVGRLQALLRRRAPVTPS